MKMLKKILLTFFTAITTVVLIYGSFTIYAASNKPNFRTATDYYTVFSAYNGEMNDFFNGKVKKLVTLVGDVDGDFYQNVEKKKLFLPPADLADSDGIPDIVKKCGEENLSSYCISIGALSKYDQYIKKLQEIKGDVNLSGVSSFSSISETLNSLDKRNQTINKQSEQANAVMQATVAAYNEFRLAYPMHVKYQEILKQLTKYKLILKDIRLRAAEFPVRFVDVSTSKCE